MRWGTLKHFNDASPVDRCHTSRCFSHFRENKKAAGGQAAADNERGLADGRNVSHKRAVAFAQLRRE